MELHRVALCSFSFLVIIFCSAEGRPQYLRAAPSNFKRVCYAINWGQYRTDGGKFLPEDIDPSLCSHLIFAFATMKGNQLAPYEWNDEGSNGMYARFIKLKEKNPDLKLLLAVGGWNFGTAKMTAMLATPENRQEFVSTSIKYLRDRGFDGLDLDFEYPANRGSPPGDKHRFTLLIQELKAAFDKEVTKTNQPTLLLTAAVGAGQDVMDKAYEVADIAKSLDFINLMSYDFHSAYEKFTGHNAPLFARPDESGDQKKLNVKYAAEYWVSNGTPREKLIIGMPTYGRGFIVSDSSKTGYGVSVNKPSPAGQYTAEAGYLAYYEICQRLSQGAVRHWNDDHKVPNYVMGNEWLGYDDPESLTVKAKWALEEGYGGWMVWSLADDDIHGAFCNEGPYPLLHALNDALQAGGSTDPLTTSPPASPSSSSKPSPSTPATPSSSPSAGPPPIKPNDNFNIGQYCAEKGKGMHPDPKKCQGYIWCVTENQHYEMSCPANTVFNPELERCDHPENVQGCSSSTF